MSEEYGIALEGNAMLDKYEALCAETGEQPRNVAIAWTLANQAVPSAIVGIRTVEHLEGVIRAAEFDLDPEIMERLNAIFPVAKFGIFVHWAEYSVPAFGGSRSSGDRAAGNGVWYPYNMYVPGSRTFEHHRSTYGDQPLECLKNILERRRSIVEVGVHIGRIEE